MTVTTQQKNNTIFLCKEQPQLQLHLFSVTTPIPSIIPSSPR